MESQAGSGAPRTRASAAAAAALALLAGLAATAVPADEPPSLRVGTSGDYAPFSFAPDPESPRLDGFDVAAARAYAEERGLRLELVRFAWGGLEEALEVGAFDVAMSGVTLRPERSLLGHFTAPVAEAEAAVIAADAGRFDHLDALDRIGVRLGVNAGGHLERAARARLPRVTLLAIPDNAAVRRALLEGLVDGVVSDTLEAPVWLEDHDEWDVVGSFGRHRKGYLVRMDRPGLAADLDSWLLARERDGTLGALRRRYLERNAAPVATELGTVLAAIDERLSIMPMIGAAKRDAGLALADPEREALVLAAALAAAQAAASGAGSAPLPTAELRQLLRAQFDAAVQVQLSAVRDPDFDPPRPLPGLEKTLRPAALRMAERIARLLVQLPPKLERAQVRAAAGDALRAPYLSQDSARALADAIAALSAAQASAPPDADRAAPFAGR